MNISLDLMQNQINQLESKVINEIDRLYIENKQLRDSIETRRFSNPNALINNNSCLIRNNNNFNSNNNMAANNSSVEIEIHFEKNDTVPHRNKNENVEQFESELSMCKEEIVKTKQNCTNVLRMDQKRLDNVKTRFNEIKQNIETTEINTKFNMSNNADNTDILETKEHFEILRKMYQETTHKLMIFRNALKDRNFMAQNQNNLTNSSNYSSTNSIKAPSSVTSSENSHLYNNNNNNNNNEHHVASSSKSSSSSASTRLNQMISNTNSNYFTEQFENNELSSNLNELEDELSGDPDDPSYIVDYKRRPISSTPTSLRTKPNQQYLHGSNAPLKQVPNNNNNNFSGNSSNNDQQIYDYSSDDTLSDNDYQLDVDNENENEYFSKSEENQDEDYSNENSDEKIDENCVNNEQLVTKVLKDNFNRNLNDNEL